MNRQRAFTLIELLTVVAIIAILAAIAVPNFLEAQVRSKISRTTADLAVLAGALRAYYADHNAYPPNPPLVRPFLEACLQVEDVNTRTLPTPSGAPIQWTRRRPTSSFSYPGMPYPGFSYPGGPGMGMNPQLGGMDPATLAMGVGPDAAPTGLPGVPSQGSNPVAYPPGSFEAFVPTDSEELTSPVARMDLATTSPSLLGQLPPESPEALGMPVPTTGTGMNLFPGGYGTSFSGYPVLDGSGDALSALTTPVAYFTRTLPIDPFSNDKTPFWYINYVEILGVEHLMTDGGRARRYLLLSFGPDTDQYDPVLPNPMLGPFIPYDPTNGAVSAGDLVRFGY